MMPVAVILCMAVLYWQHSQQLETYLKDTSAPAGKALFLQSPTSTATGKPLTILLIGVHDICTLSHTLCAQQLGVALHSHPSNSVC